MTIKAALKIVKANKLAALCGVTPAFISHMKTGRKAIPPALCPKIEAATGGLVTRAQLRPDIFGKLPKLPKIKEKGK
jgi:DNA-binding transcriptional regulator YdaS (Cro superfamily)